MRKPPAPMVRSEPPARGLLSRWIFGDNCRFLKFAVVGGSGVIVNEGLLYLCADVLFASLAADLRVPLAGFIAIGVSIFTNFLLNDAWTWGDVAKRGRLHFFQRLGKYYVVAAVAAGLNYGLLLLLWRGAGLHHLFANLIAIPCAMVVHFFMQNRWTFAR